MAKARAGAAFDAEQRRVVAAEWATRARVRRAWAAWSASQERAQLARESLENVAQIDATVGELARLGELSRIEARLFRIELVGRRTDAARAEIRADELRLGLLSLLGLAPGSDVVLVPELELHGAAARPDAEQMMIERNATLAVRRAEYRVAEESLRLEVRKQYPDITIGTGYGREGDDRLLLGLSLPVPSLNRNRAGIAEATVRREVARAAAETEYERLSAELQLAMRRFAAAEDQLSRYETDIVPLIAEQAADLDRLAALGEVNTLVLLDAVTRQIEAKSTALQLRVDAIQASITIEELLGPETRHEPTQVNDQQNQRPRQDAGEPIETAEEGAL